MSFKEKRVTVTVDSKKADAKPLIKALEKAGFGATLIPQKAGDTLPRFAERSV